jgi:hypothetical protein
MSRRSILLIGIIGLILYLVMELRIIAYAVHPTSDTQLGDEVLVINFANMGLALIMGVFSCIWMLKTKPKDRLVGFVYFAPLLMHGLVLGLGYSVRLWASYFRTH